MKFAVRKDYLFFTSVVYGLTACAAAGGAPAATGGAGVAAAMSSAGSGAMMATAAPAANGAAGTGTSTAGVATAGGAGSAAGGPSTTGAGVAMGGPTFTKVFNLLAGGCASGGYCHAAGGGLSKLELVDQTKAYAALVGTPAMGMAMPGSMAMGCATSMLLRVKAGDPDNSVLMQKLEGKETCGTEMPPNGTLRPDELKLVRDWIMDGAMND